MNGYNKRSYASARRLAIIIYALACSVAGYAQIPDLTNDDNGTDTETSYIDIVYNGVSSGGESPTYSFTPEVTRHNIDDATHIESFKKFTLDGCTVECELSENLTIDGVDGNGFTLFKLTSGTSGTISIKATDNGLWTGYHYTTAYFLSHKQVYFEACLLDSDNDNYVDDDSWEKVVIQGEIDWSNNSTAHGDTVVRAPKGTYSFGDYGSGSTSEAYISEGATPSYPYYKAYFTSPNTVSGSEYGKFGKDTTDVFYITISGLSEGQTIGLKNVTLRERVSTMTQATPRFDVTLNYEADDNSDEDNGEADDDEEESEGGESDGVTTTYSPVITSEIKGTEEDARRYRNFDLELNTSTTADTAKSCRVAANDISGGSIVGVDGNGFTQLHLNSTSATDVIGLKMTAPTDGDNNFNWTDPFKVYHYEVSYDVYLLDNDGDYLPKDQWGSVSVEGARYWGNTPSSGGSRSGTGSGAIISSSYESQRLNTDSNTDKDPVRIIAEHDILDADGNKEGVYYTVSYTEDLTDSWLEIWQHDELPVQITNLAQGQTVALRDMTITCRITNDDYSYYEYYTSYEYNNGETTTTTPISDVSVTHKPAKWYNVRERTTDTEYNDDFDYDKTTMGAQDAAFKTLADGTSKVQATHEMVDTIYMLKGTSMTILIPQVQASYNNCSVNNYFRWYNYLNDKNLYCGDNANIGSDNDDLITPVEINNQEATAWRFANGYVSGNLNYEYNSTAAAQGSSDYSRSHTLRKISFYYPTDTEFANIQSNTNSSFSDTDNNDYYAIACDMSLYNDFSTADYTPNNPAYPNQDEKNSFCSDHNWCEPTLAVRNVYYIVGIGSTNSTAPTDLPDAFKQYWKLFGEDASSYKGGTNAEGSKYLEEYEITMPSRRISNKTNELVALTKDAQSYALPGETTTGSLSVSFASGEDNGLTLVNSTLSGDSRTIQFYKGTSGSTWDVTDGSTATILVTKTVNDVTYNLVRYKLTFKDYATPLTEPQVHSLDDISDDNKASWWWGKQAEYRAPSYMSDNYNVIASLDFDYCGDKEGYFKDQLNTSTIYGKVNNISGTSWPGMYYNYPFPLKWEDCGYAFYDGSYDVASMFTSSSVSGYSTDGDIDATELAKYSVMTKWGMYDIVNYYVGYGELAGSVSPQKPAYPSVKNHKGNWLYLDASDRPGTVAELEFGSDLCKGAQLAITAWIKSDSHTDDDAAVLLTVTGVKTVDGVETHTPVYKQYSGQIRTTQDLSETDCDDASISGKGSGTNEWFQIFCTFNNSDKEYDYYTLRVDNCCASTDGGDYYFDEVCVYARRATLDVVQANSICSTDEDEKSLIKVSVDYESLMQYIGLDPSDYETTDVDDLEGDDDKISSVDFVVINRVKYEDFIAQHSDEVGSNSYGTEDALKKAAIEYAAAPIYVSYDSDAENAPYGEGVYNSLLNFHDYYYKNTAYDSDNEPQLPEKSGEEGSEKYYFYSLQDATNDAEQDYKLMVELYVDFTSYTDYAIIMEYNAGGSSLDDWEAVFIDLMDSPCAFSTEFYIVPMSTIIKVDGEAVNPTVTSCVGQTSHIEPEVDFSLIAGDAEQITIEGGNIYFDWFFGTMEEYQTEIECEVQDADPAEASLEEALADFRSIYLSASEPAEPTEDDVEDGYTEADYNAIKYWYDQGKLLLYRRSVDVTMTEADKETAGGIRLVIRPLRVTVTAKNSGGEDDDITDLVCWDEVTLSILADGDSPTISPGFSYISDYPEDYIPSLRLGVKQAQQACDEDNAITVSLRGVNYADEVNETTVEGLRAKDGMNSLYLVSTDDRDYSALLGVENFDKYSIPVGTVKSLTGTKATAGEDATEEKGSMEIYFDFDYDHPEFKEGYSYFVSVYFEEDMEEGAEANSCLGTFPLEIKVVPEYLVWQGDETNNWNDDSMWHRATQDELHGLTPYEAGTTNGFVPMLFSKVVIPESKAAELYMAGFKETTDDNGDNTGTYEWVENVDDYEPAFSTDKPTENIMYDLMVYEDKTNGKDNSKLTTGHFRTATVDQLHLEAGAMLLHPELLVYDKAWTDVRVEQNQWLLTSTPLEGVVAGDWYTGTDGTEPTPYFTDIKFTDDNSRDRTEPLVFQRGWGSDATMVNTSADDDADDDDEEEGKTSDLPVYLSTSWTSVYNNSSVTQAPGAGFSIEAELPTSGTYGASTGDVTFRFPKADETFDYMSDESLSRTGAGTLLVSGLASRTDPDKDADASSVYPSANSTVSVTLTPSTDGYCLVGNPFTAYLSLKKFFAVNGGEDGALEDKYWVETALGPVWGSGDFTSIGVTYDDYYIEPYSAFFVEAKKNDEDKVPETVTVTFTYDMQTLEKTPPAESPVKAFFIKATGGDGVSGAAVQYSGEAQDGYNSGEDVVLVRSLTGQTQSVPMVYTVSGDRAVSLNRLRSLSVIPLGVYAEGDEEYTLSFTGVDYLGEPVLYDAQEDTRTPLMEGDELALQGSSHGRFYILTTTDIEDETADEPYISVSSRRKGEVSVCASEEIQRVEVFSVGGLLLGSLSPGGIACTLDGLPRGIAIVHVTTTQGTAARKVMVR